MYRSVIVSRIVADVILAPNKSQKTRNHIGSFGNMARFVKFRNVDTIINFFTMQRK